MSVRVAVLYPDRLNLYADRGNLLVLARRAARNDIDLELHAVGIGDDLPSGSLDVVYLGGGQDADQRRCAADLVRHRSALVDAASGGAVVLGICGGFQLLGHEYRLDGDSVPGIGLLDVATVAGQDRLAGNVAVEVSAAPLLGAVGRHLAGFENHRGRSTLGPDAVALGRVLAGKGNDGAGPGGGEGAVAALGDGLVVGTYLHGPLLAKNVWLADWLLSRAVGSPLAAPPGPFDDLVHRRALAAAHHR